MSVTNRVWWGRDSSIVDAISLGIRGNVDLDEDNNCLGVFGKGGLFEDMYTIVNRLNAQLLFMSNI